MTTTERLNELKRLYRKRHPVGNDSGGEGGTSGNWGGGATVGTEEKGKPNGAMVDPRDSSKKRHS